MISEEKEIDVLADINRNLDRIAMALETIVKAAVQGSGISAEFCVRTNDGRS